MATVKNQFTVYGMHCQACAARIEKVLKQNQAVTAADVNFATEEANVTYERAQISPEELIAVIRKVGYEAAVKELWGADTTALNPDIATPWHLILLWLIAAPFLIGMIGMFTGRHYLMLPAKWQFILSTFAQLFLTVPLYKSATAALKNRFANMDVLVVMGTTVIWLYSAVMFLFPRITGTHYLYFEANVMVLAFIALGKYIESKTKHGSLNSLNKMLELLPKTARVRRSGKWQSLACGDIKPGDIIKSGLGDKICADGVVISGRAWLDTSHLTGEALPLAAEKDMPVSAGALVTDGVIEYRAVTTGAETRLGDMITALNNALATKAPLARIADQVAAVFVPTVIIIAFLSLIINYVIYPDFTRAVVNAVAVLVIACPCALGLATPAAVMAGMGLGGKNGVWFKNAAVLEAAAGIDSVVFDKTGTVTAGKLSITGSWIAPDSPYSEAQLLTFIAAAEQGNSHPIAQVFTQEAAKAGLQLPAVNTVNNFPGSGLTAELAAVGTVKIGNLIYTDYTLPPALSRAWAVCTVIAVAVNGKPSGAFALSDILKADSAAALLYLTRKMKITPYMLSGDKQSVVSYWAAKLAIPADHAQGEQSPRAKLTYIQNLLNHGNRVAMVGDGVNDAAALAKATVGMAMGGGSAIAEQSAGITLTRPALTNVIAALQIGTATVRNIKQNLFFAFIYNIIGIPLAACGFLTPVWAGLAMSLSSVSVLANALRLKRLRLFHYPGA